MKSVNQRARYALQIAAALLIVCVCGVAYIFLSMNWGDGEHDSLSPVIALAEPPATGAESATGQVSGNSNVPDVNAKRVDQNQSIPEAVEWQAESYAAVLAGTEIDGQLQVDSAGNLVLDLSVKDFFDYFLSAVGEVSAADAILEIQKQAQARVPDQAVQQVMQLLESYVAYQHALQEIMDQSLRPPEEQNYTYFAETMEKTFEHIKRLRREYMSPEAADAFFRLEEAYAEFAVNSMKIRAKDHLTPEEQAIQIRALEAKMPDNMQSAQAAARESAELANQARDLFDAGEPEAVIRDQLSKNYSTETIDSMLEHYQREQDWQNRLDQYLALHQYVYDSVSDPAEQQQQLETLRHAYFSDDELPRLKAHEAIYRKTVLAQGALP